MKEYQCLDCNLVVNDEGKLECSLYYDIEGVCVFYGEQGKCKGMGA
jgi:hypothetical protein